MLETGIAIAAFALGFLAGCWWWSSAKTVVRGVVTHVDSHRSTLTVSYGDAGIRAGDTLRIERPAS